ncbi:MAG TPA: suppressor of fused domain protein, partial [Pyrinomonadaceae bacterium]|nr:suppressor of fused domain protein [Pyrinomonadaceae bacterium]
MSDETIIFTGNRKQAAFLALVAAVFVFLIYFTGNRDAWTILGVAFFGVGFLVCIYNVIPGTVQLKVHRSGIEMKSLFKPMKLSWNDVDEFYVGYTRSGLSRTKMIGIKFSETYKKQQTGRKISASLTGMEGALPDHFNRSAEEICEVLNEYKRTYSGSDEQPAEHYGKLWLDALEARFGEVTAIKKIQCPDKPIIYVFFFAGLPEPGFLTAVTCNLSAANHPDWKFGAPELIVTMQSESDRWGMAAGYFASLFFGEKRFRYGDIFKIDDPISPEEGEMNAYLLFAPSFLDREQSKFVLPDRTVYLVGMYPIYDDEIAIY